RGDHRVVQHLFAASADCDLRRLVIEPVLTPEFVANRALQLNRAIEYGIARLAAPHRRYCRLLDARRRVEIGLADRQAHDVTPSRLQFGGERGHRHGRRRFDASEAIGEKGHDVALAKWRQAEYFNAPGPSWKGDHRGRVWEGWWRLFPAPIAKF